MLRLTLTTEEYLQLGDNVKIAFLGGTGKHLRIMVDAPKEVNVARGKYIEKMTTDPEERAKLPRYYAEPETPEKYRRKKNIIIHDTRIGAKAHWEAAQLKRGAGTETVIAEKS